MSQEWVIKALVDLGLKRTDVRVYLFLAKTGPQKARDITEALKMHKQQLYRSLKNLQSKECVKATPEHPALFSAVPPEKVLDTLIKSKMKEAQNIQRNKQELLSIWQSMTTDDSTN
jgi:sugar-specific transcriptional regulator TrmB